MVIVDSKLSIDSIDFVGSKVFTVFTLPSCSIVTAGIKFSFTVLLGSKVSLDWGPLYH